MPQPKSQIIQRTNAGLIEQQNPIFAPEGSLKKAENAVADREGVIGNRRGFFRYLASSAEALGEFKDRAIIHDGTNLKYDSDGAGTLATYSGTYSVPDSSRRMRFLEYGGSLYFTTSQGVMKLDSLTGTIRRAGMPPGLDLQLALDAGGTWFLNNTAVSYRVLWIRKDANRRDVRGAPSWRVTLANTSGVAKGIVLTTTIPADIILGDSYEIYRSDLSADATSDPLDELFLVAQVAVTSGDLSNGYVTYTDSLDKDKGLPLETNASELTIDQKADRPPWCLDLLEYRGYIFYLNIKREHRLEIQLLTVTGITDDVDGITVTVDGVPVTYTFSTAENIGLKKFQRYTSGSAAENVRNTVQSLLKVMNRSAVATYGFYTSEETDRPGRFIIQCRNLGTNAITVTATAGCSSKFTPTVPTSGTTLISDNIAQQNGFAWSRFETPDACPEANLKTLGSRAIVRGSPLTFSLLILKEDGVWRRTGYSEADFTDTPLDPSVHVTCPDAVDILDNNVYAVSLEGLVRATDAGVAIVSWPVDLGFKRFFSYPNYQSIVFGVSYHSAFKFLLWAPEFQTDTHAQIGWIWNHLTEKWTTWRKPVQCGIVMDGEDILLLGHGDDSYVLKERKSWETTLADYMDEEIPVTITATGTTTDEDGNTVSTADLTYTYTGMDLDTGFCLEQPAKFMSSAITAVLSLGGTSYRVTCEEQLPALQTGAAFVALPIPMEIEWKPEAVGNPAVEKLFLEDQKYLEDEGARHFQVGFNSDSVPQLNFYTRELQLQESGWGLTGWGSNPWGDADPSRAPILRTIVPTQYGRCRALSSHLKHSWAKERVSILAQALVFRQTTEKTVTRDR